MFTADAHTDVNTDVDDVDANIGNGIDICSDLTKGRLSRLSEAVPSPLLFLQPSDSLTDPDPDPDPEVEAVLW